MRVAKAPFTPSIFSCKASATRCAAMRMLSGWAVEFGETAKRQLRLFAPSQEREALTGLADYVLLRDR